MVKIMKNKKGLQLVTSFKKFLVLVIYHLGNIDESIQSGICVIPKITFANLCKPICNVVIIPVSSDALHFGNCRKEGEKITEN